jgi:hypothetical protein
MLTSAHLHLVFVGTSNFVLLSLYVSPWHVQLFSVVRLLFYLFVLMIRVKHIVTYSGIFLVNYAICFVTASRSKIYMAYINWQFYLAYHPKYTWSLDYDSLHFVLYYFVSQVTYEFCQYVVTLVFNVLVHCVS